MNKTIPPEILERLTKTLNDREEKLSKYAFLQGFVIALIIKYDNDPTLKNFNFKEWIETARELTDWKRFNEPH